MRLQTAEQSLVLDKSFTKRSEGDRNVRQYKLWQANEARVGEIGPNFTLRFLELLQRIRNSALW